MDKDNIKSTNCKNYLQTSLFSLSEFCNKKVEVRFTTEQISTNGGLPFLKEVGKNIGLIERITSCLKNDRHQRYVSHHLESLVNQRVMQIAAGYEDANDCDSLRDDGVLKICCNSEKSLSSQPAMSRFENAVSNKELHKIVQAFADQFISSYEKQPEVVILDCDDTNAQTYGGQQSSLFNTYYDGYCYMPLHIYEGLPGKLITSLLKPGRRSKSLNVFGILKRLIQYLRKYWPETLIILRGDSHFCSHEFMDWAETRYRIGFLTGPSGNSLLNRKAQTTMESARREHGTTGKPVKRYHSFDYRAGTWSHSQRVVAKVEASEKGSNVRYVVTNIRCVRTKALYENAYSVRGAVELRIKDHKTYLKSDRMSCNSFKANQFRLFLHSAAYVLIHALQHEALAATDFCRSTMKTIQLKIIKIASRVKILKTKVKIEFPKQFPEREVFENLLLMFGILKD